MNFLVREDMDLALAGRLGWDDYGARYGLTDERSGQLHIDWSWQPSPDTRAYVFLGFDRVRRQMANINAAGPLSDDPNAGGVVFPLERAWWVRMRETHWSLGAGVALHPHRRVEIRMDYRFDAFRGEGSTHFASDLALGTGLTAAEAGRRLPDLRKRDHVLETAVRWSVQENLLLRFYHRFQRASIRDWHESGLTPQVAGAVFLGHQDGDFEASVYGVSVEWRL